MGFSLKPKRLFGKFHTPSTHVDSHRKVKWSFGSWKKPIRREWDKDSDYYGDDGSSSRSIWDMTHAQHSANTTALRGWYPSPLRGGRYA